MRQTASREWIIEGLSKITKYDPFSTGSLSHVFSVLGGNVIDNYSKSITTIVL